MIDRYMTMRAIRNNPVDYFIACRPVRPLPVQVRIVHDAVAVSREYLELPDFDFVWRDADDDICNGATAFVPDSGRIVVYLNANAFPESLRRAVYYELQRVADVAAGEAFDRVTLEERAVRFANEMMGHR